MRSRCPLCGDRAVAPLHGLGDLGQGQCGACGAAVRVRLNLRLLFLGLALIGQLLVGGMHVTGSREVDAVVALIAAGLLTAACSAVAPLRQVQ